MADARVRLAFDRAAPTYDAAAEVQRETLHSLIDALPARLRCPAPTILDVGCGTGRAFRPLFARYPDAHLIGLDFAGSMLRTASRPHPDRLSLLCADAARLPLPAACADLVFSSMTWQWCALPAVLAEARRCLTAGGTLAFSTLTAGTFHEVATAFRGIDAHPHTLRLLDRAAVRAAVLDAGFGDLCERSVTRIARYDSAALALRSIRATGASEVGGPRRPGLLGKSAWRTIEARWRDLADPDGRLPLSYEVLEVVAAR
jgi:malonyl-CoA O-methyltransferase